MSYLIGFVLGAFVVYFIYNKEKVVNFVNKIKDNFKK